MMKKYTETPIPGRDPQRILPSGVGLVCEGGGTRGFFSAGVFEAFMEAGILFPHICGISAGAANALSYISGQRLRSRQIVEHYVPRHEYVSRRNILLHRSMFGYDFIFREIPEEHIFFDWDVLLRQPISYNAGAFDCNTGETVWFGNNDLRGADGRGDLTCVLASCSVPLMSRIVDYKGGKYLDGGIHCSIPIEKSIADGNDFHVVILTRNEGFVKPPMGHEKLIRMFYRKYPKVAEALETRHTVYNQQLELCENLAAQGRAMIIRPQAPVGDSRTSTDVTVLLRLYDEGTDLGRTATSELLKRFA